MAPLLILIIASILAFIAGCIELVLHNRNVRRIPIRIHVNGTRGKSSVTRLIAAGLREAGIPTCAKVTGTLARMILPDATEYPIYRPAGANIIEQKRIMKTATSYRARALVVECMALQPLLQWLCESKLIQATHAVITNTRADHIDIMGPTDHDVALALAGMIPENGKVYTNERRLFTILENVARDRSAAITPITPADVAAVTEDDMRGFSYVEHPENVALALQVCEDLGVARDVALTGMRNVEPDAGALLVYQLDFFGRHICFVNGFAANDPESTAIIWHMMIQRYPEIQKRIAIFNCRDDRVDRSWQLGSACVNWMPADHYLLVGTGTFVFARAMVKHGMDMTKVVIAEDRRADDIFETFIGFAGRTSLVMGMGNIGGVGLDLVNYFRNRSEPENGV